MVLKGAVKARDEHIDSLRQAMQLLEHKHRTFFTTPFPVVEILEKNPDPAVASFLSGHPGAFLNLPKNRQIQEHSLTTKIPTHHAKLKFCR